MRDLRAGLTTEGAEEHRGENDPLVSPLCASVPSVVSSSHHGLHAITTEEITDTTALHSLGPEWTDLWQRCSWVTPFQSPAWLLPWWQYFGGANLRTVALRRAGLLVGLVPLFVSD